MKRPAEPKRDPSKTRSSVRRVPPRARGSAAGLELRHLRVFVALVDHGNMTAAAQRLGVAQSTISEALTGLERALGTRIMKRGRGVQTVDLRPAGRALLPYARNVLASVEDAYVAVAGVARDVHGGLELVANESVSTYLLPPALGVLREKWPNIQFAVTVGMCPSIYDGLSSGRFDVGLMLQMSVCAAEKERSVPEVQTPVDRLLHLSDVSLVVFAGVKHPLATGNSEGEILRERLAPYPVFVSDAKGYFYDLIRAFFRSDGIAAPRLQPTGSVEAVKRSVVTSPHGIGVLPEYAVAEELRAGVVQALTVRPCLPPVRLAAVLYRTREPMHPAVVELIEVLRTMYAGVGTRD